MWLVYKSYGQDSYIRQGVFKVAPFDGLIFVYQTDPVGYASMCVFLKFIDFELYELYCAWYLCRGIGQTLCSFEHVSCSNRDFFTEEFFYTVKIQCVVMCITMSTTSKGGEKLCGSLLGEEWVQTMPLNKLEQFGISSTHEVINSESIRTESLFKGFAKKTGV